MPKKVCRDRVLRVRATQEEMDRWKALAAEAELPLSRLVRQSLGRVRAWSPGKAALHRQRSVQIARIGSNLNQIARWANTYKGRADTIQVIARLVALDREIAALSGDRRSSGNDAD